MHERQIEAAVMAGSSGAAPQTSQHNAVRHEKKANALITQEIQLKTHDPEP